MDLRPMFRLRGDDQVAGDEPEAFAHADQTEAGSALRRFGTEASARIRDAKV